VPLHTVKEHIVKKGQCTVTMIGAVHDFSKHVVIMSMLDDVPGLELIVHPIS
jgi:hypothetical protein